MYFYSCVLTMRPIDKNAYEMYNAVLQVVETCEECAQSRNMRH